MDVSLVFKIHQPFRIKRGMDYMSKNLEDRYFDSNSNRSIFERVALKCYEPATLMFLDLVNRMKNQEKKFKVAFSISGIWMEQAERWQPDLIDIFKEFPKDCVEFLGETYYHSLAGLFEKHNEYEEQLKLQAEMMKSIFGRKPNVVTNTELIYNNLIARSAENLGFKGIFTEGVPHHLGWRSPNFVYKAPDSKIAVLLRNRSLTDDIGYRFSAQWWDQWPLTAEKYAKWVADSRGNCLNIYMDYETIGEHQWHDTGIFWFFQALPFQINSYEHLNFSSPSEIIKKYKAVGDYDVFELATISWADLEMDTSAWLGNKMQMLCFKEIKELETLIKKTNKPELLRAWRLLQTSDHMHNICTKNWGDGDVHKYFSHFDSPHQGFISMMEILHDLKNMIIRQT